MSQDKLNELLNYTLVGSGAAGTATVQFWQNMDLGMSIFLKFISLASFICFLLINQIKIKEGWIKFKDRFRNGTKIKKGS